MAGREARHPGSSVNGYGREGARQEEERKGWQECVERGDKLF